MKKQVVFSQFYFKMWNPDFRFIMDGKQHV